MLKRRHALVLAGDDTQIALDVAEGLVDVGASVVLACKRPELLEKAAERITQLAHSQQPSIEGADGSGAAGDVAPWLPGCTVRPLDLSSRISVCEFAETMLREDAPLHVIVNCADDFHPFYGRPVPQAQGGWERTVGGNHLGPFLLTQLLLDQVVTTMRRDADTSKARAQATGSYRVAAARARAAKAEAARARRRRRKGVESTNEERRAEDLRARPYPAPLGRVVSLGLDARTGQGRRAGEEVPAVAGLFLRAGNYSGWRAYRCAHEANTLAALQLSRMLAVVRVPTGDGRGGRGECVEVNIVRPSHGRWLPRPLRKLFGTTSGVALTATFLASTPVRGLSGLFFDNFESEPAWAKSAQAPTRARQGDAAKRLYSASMALTGHPPADWRAEAAMTMRGFLAEQRRRAATIRGRPSSPSPDGEGGGQSGEPRGLQSAPEKPARGPRRQPAGPVELDVAALLEGGSP